MSRGGRVNVHKVSVGGNHAQELEGNSSLNPLTKASGETGYVPFLAAGQLVKKAANSADKN